MSKKTRLYYKVQQRAQIWDRYQQGDSLHYIARIFDRFNSSIQDLITRTGGIRPPDKKGRFYNLPRNKDKKFLFVY